MLAGGSAPAGLLAVVGVFLHYSAAGAGRTRIRTSLKRSPPEPTNAHHAASPAGGLLSIGSFSGQTRFEA